MGFAQKGEGNRSDKEKSLNREIALQNLREAVTGVAQEFFRTNELYDTALLKGKYRDAKRMMCDPMNSKDVPKCIEKYGEGYEIADKVLDGIFFADYAARMAARGENKLAMSVVGWADEMKKISETDEGFSEVAKELETRIRHAYEKANTAEEKKLESKEQTARSVASIVKNQVTSVETETAVTKEKRELAEEIEDRSEATTLRAAACAFLIVGTVFAGTLGSAMINTFAGANVSGLVSAALFALSGGAAYSARNNKEKWDNAQNKLDALNKAEKDID